MKESIARGDTNDLRRYRPVWKAALCRRACSLRAGARMRRWDEENASRLMVISVGGRGRRYRGWDSGSISMSSRAGAGPRRKPEQLLGLT